MVRGAYFPHREAILDGLKTFKSLPESERKPAPAQRLKWPSPLAKPAANTLILKEYNRIVYRDSGGQVRPTPAEPGADYMWITESEMRAMIPADAKTGGRFPFPEPVWKRFFPNQFYHYLASTHTAPVFDVEKAKPTFTLIVENNSSDHLKMRLDGSAAIRLQCSFGETLREDTVADMDFRMLGYLDFDKRTHAFVRFDLVGVGTFAPRTSHGGHRHIPSDWEAPAGRSLIFGMTFELGSGKSADLAPPKRLQYGEASYFGTKK